MAIATLAAACGDDEEAAPTVEPPPPAVAAPVRSEPAENRGEPAATLCTGNSYACAVRAGRIHCWGKMWEHLPPPRDFGPKPFPETEGAVEVACGRDFACLRRADGTVACWGTGSLGQLGTEVEVGDYGFRSRWTPETIAGLDDAEEIALGSLFGCARRASGTVVCWGSNQGGTLGDGSSVEHRHTPAPVSGLSNVVDISIGGSAACALTEGGRIFCWGQPLGEEQARTPVEIAIEDVVEVVARSWGGCARTSDGRVICWGSNDSGELGDGTTEARSEPVVVSNVSGARALNRVSSRGFCATLAAGRVLCWGFNANAELGRPRSNERPTPTPVAAFEGLAFADTHSSVSCGTRTDGSVWCWGEDRFGVVGAGGDDEAEPTRVEL
jgi:alpha-tubulin suppressor-like RCC1 family protein